MNCVFWLKIDNNWHFLLKRSYTAIMIFVSSAPSRPSMKLRLAWLKKLGGLPRVEVTNKEWLELLQEETRQSLMIEGSFWTKDQIKRILSGRKGSEEVIGYFDAALDTYVFANAQRLENECSITRAHIRHIHAIMFRGVQINWPAGEWRKGNIRIGQAKIVPPDYTKLDELMTQYVEVVNHHPDLHPWTKAALGHVVFEAIHPFPDGNGRVGRVLMNFFLICGGLPSIAIKGGDDGQRYYDALEEADRLSTLFLAGKTKFGKKDLAHLKKLEDIIFEELAPALDSHICALFEEKTGNQLLPYKEVAQLTSRRPNSFQVSLSAKQFISVKRKGKLFTHPLLLESPQ